MICEPGDLHAFPLLILNKILGERHLVFFSISTYRKPGLKYVGGTCCSDITHHSYLGPKPRSEQNNLIFFLPQRAAVMIYVCGLVPLLLIDIKPSL